MIDYKVVLPTTTEEWQRDMNIAYQQGRAEAIDEMKDKLQLSAIYSETENGWSGMTVDTIQIEEIANELKEQCKELVAEQLKKGN